MPKEKVLIIKTGYAEFLDYDLNSRKVSLGDVLRTTPLLNLFKDADVSWVTDKEAVPLLDGNPLIDRLMAFDQFLPFQLENERFDTIINLEKVPGICAMTDKMKAWKRYGFRFDSETGKAEAHDRAFEVLAVGANKNMKRLNTRTSQNLLFSMLGKEWRGEEYVLAKQPKNKEKYEVGLNVFVGSKWPTKAWSIKKWDALEKRLSNQGTIVSRQDKQSEKILTNINAYTDWINSCKNIVTCDSLGLHLGIALKKNLIGLFSATSISEIEFYGRGKGILPKPLPKCLPCFEPVCARGKNCIENISVNRVYNTIMEYLSNSKK